MNEIERDYKIFKSGCFGVALGGVLVIAILGVVCGLVTLFSR